MNRRFFSPAAAAALMLASVSVWSCMKDELTEEGFRLHYPDVVEIAQNITYNLEPTWSGGTPSDFSITQVTCEGSVYIGQEFSINADNGVITITGTANTTPADYILSISCSAGGRDYDFPDKVTVHFINGVPEGISMDPAVIGADISELEEGSDAELQTAQVVTEGEHIEIQSYAIRNVKFEGTIVDNVTNPLFAISETGEVSFVKGGPFELGTYTLDLKLSTRSYSEESSIGLFADALTVNIVSAPTDLVYTPDRGKVEADGATAFTSRTPVLTGTPDGITYSIDVTTEPADAAGADRISIDPATGVISFAAGEALEVGTVYMVDVIVESAYTEEPVTFQNRFLIEVVDEIAPISGFSYASASANALTKKEALGWTVAPDEGVAGVSWYEFSDPSAEYARHIALDTETGELSIEKLNDLAVGLYNVEVTAHNDKGETTEASLVLTIEDNPQYFTYFSYGNNLGLTEEETDGVSQFRVSSREELQGLSRDVQHSDLSPNANVKFSSRHLANFDGAKVDASGHLNLDCTNWENRFKANQIGSMLVTATTTDPSDPENTFTVTVPVFVSYYNPAAIGGGVELTFNPFVLRVNPRTGGRGVPATLIGTTHEALKLDYRRTFNYYNIDGRQDGEGGNGEEFVNGQQTNSSSNTVDGSTGQPVSFLFTMWQKYYDSMGETVPTSGRDTNNKDAVGYFSGTNVDMDLPYKLLYVDNADDGANKHSVFVPAGVWYNYGWADGIFTGQMTFSTDGSSPSKSNSNDELGKFFPYAVWFDKDFEE